MSSETDTVPVHTDTSVRVMLCTKGTPRHVLKAAGTISQGPHALEIRWCDKCRVYQIQFRSGMYVVCEEPSARTWKQAEAFLILVRIRYSGTDTDNFGAFLRECARKLNELLPEPVQA